MKKLFAPLVVALLSFTSIAEEWKTVTLIDKVTVSLPGTPTTDNSKGIPMQNVVLGDSSEVNAFAIDFSSFGMSEEMLQQMATTDQFKQMLEGQAASQAGVKILKNEMGKYADKYTMYNTTIELNNDDYKGTINQRTIFYRKYGITMIYKPGKKGIDEAIKDKVFSSVKFGE